MPENIADIKRKSVYGVLWKFGEGASSQAISFIVSMILARLLMPAQYGVVAVTMLFISVLSVIANGGLSSALMQKKDTDQLDYNTAFYTNLCLSGVLYLLLFIAAPFIARAYDDPLICATLRVLGLSMFFGCFTMVQGAIVARDLAFKRFFWASFISVMISGVIGVTMAYKGFGVWALVAQNLSASIISIFVINRMIKWLPRLQFSMARLREMFAYSMNLLAASIIGMIFNKLNGFVMGLRFTPADLALYNRGESLPTVLTHNINGAIQGVLFPSIAKLQDDKALVKSAFRHAMMASCYAISPIMFFLAGAADNLIIALFSDRWAAAIPFMRIVAISYSIFVLSNSNLIAISAMKRSDLVLKGEFFKKPVALAAIAIAAFISPIALAVASFVTFLNAFLVNAYYNSKVINYSIREQILDVLPQFALSAAAGAAAFAIGLSPLNIYLEIVLQLIAAAAIYLGGSIAFNLESFHYVKQTVAQLRHREI